MRRKEKRRFLLVSQEMQCPYDMTAIINIEAVTRYYGKHRGIEDLTFEVTEGTVFGFLSPNGAGKTATIRVLMGLLRPTAGHTGKGGKMQRFAVFLLFVVLMMAPVACGTNQAPGQPGVASTGTLVVPKGTSIISPTPTSCSTTPTGTPTPIPSPPLHPTPAPTNRVCRHLLDLLAKSSS